MKKLLITSVVGILCQQAVAAPSDLKLTLPKPQISLYGTFDNSISYISDKNGHDDNSITSQKRWPNFIGIKAKESLDKNWTGLLKFERGILLNTGGVYNRQAWIGLSHKRFGKITAGKQYDVIQAIVPFTTAIDNTLTSEHPGDYDREAGVTLDEVLKYENKLSKHFTSTLIYSPGSDNSSTNTGKAYGINGVYMDTHFGVYLGAERIGGETVTPATDIGVPKLFGQSADNTYTLDHKNIYAFAALYRNASLKIVSSISKTKMEAYRTQETMNSYDLGVVYQITPRVNIQSGYSYTDMSNYNWNIYNISSEYKFSRNARVFITGVYQTVGNDQNAVLFKESVANGQDQFVVRLGFLYKFNVDF